MIPIVDLKRQYKQTGAEIEKAVVDVLRSGAYILGPNTKALEQEFAQYLGTKHAIGLNSGTDALHLALRALDIGKGDEAIGILFNPGDTNDLEQKLIQLYNDRQLTTQFGQKAFQKLTQEYSSEVIYSKWLKLLQKVSV